MTKRKLAQFAKVFIYVITAIAACLQIYSSFIYDGEKMLGIFGLVAIAFIISIVLIKQERKIREQSDRFSRVMGLVNANIAKINASIKEFSDEGNFYKLMIASWRLDTESKKFRHIGDGQWTLLAYQTYDYFLYIFKQIILGLREGDEYVTLSSLDFWKNDRPDEEIKRDLEPSLRNMMFGNDLDFRAEIGSFLTANIHSCMRGVEINRIIIVDAISLGSNDDDSQLKDLKKLIEHFRKREAEHPAVKLGTLFFSLR